MSDVTCRGSFALGTACGGCSRCRREIESYNAMKSVRDKLNTPSSAISRIEELEAKLAICKKYRDAYAECDKIATQAVRDLEAKLAKAVEELNFAYDTLGEINVSNYDHDDVCNLNDKSVEVVLSIKATLAELTGGKDE